MTHLLRLKEPRQALGNFFASGLLCLREKLGPILAGMTGFGASAFATGGRLYVSTIKGHLQRLTEDGSAWEIVAKTPTARFFHRMLPLDETHLIMVGGANMGIGKFEEIEFLDVAAPSAGE